jgi:hypothetical protein
LLKIWELLSTGIELNRVKRISMSVKTKFIDALKAEENSIKAGWDKKLNLWFPHKSLEGGTDTLAYGHKLASDGLVRIGNTLHYAYDGITEQMACVLFKQDLDKAIDKARTQYNKKFKKFHRSFEELPEKYQLLLANIVYNSGTILTRLGFVGWPKLIAAMHEGSDYKVRKEMITSYIDPKTKKRIYLTKRAERIADALGLSKEI